MPISNSLVSFKFYVFDICLLLSTCTQGFLPRLQEEKKNTDIENMLLMVNSASLLNQDIKVPAKIMYVGSFIW